MWLRKAIVSAPAAVVVLLVVPTEARADGWFGNVTCGQAGQPACELTAGSAASGDQAAPATPHSAGPPAVAAPEAQKPCTPDIPPGLVDPADQAAWHDFVCAGTNIASGSFVTPEVVFDPVEIAAIARQRLELPEPAISTSPGGDQLVNLPTWLWLSTGWRTVSATASVPGVSVTATATPIAASWSMGDGNTVACAGSGTSYTDGSDPQAASPDCGHVYRRSSAGQPGHVFPVTATVRWKVSWSGAGGNGTFPDLTTRTSAGFRVAESQALNYGGR